MLIALFCCNTALALPLVEKQTFTTKQFALFSGKVLPEVTVGWESYGELNEAKDNVILITHYFSGSSHAAGKYHEDDAQPGYWDAIIGPGKPIDTSKYFVISVDSLANLSAYDDNVITTGPASVNPETNKPYGLDFPVVTIRDFVNVQKAVLESLGIRKLHAVIGPSMGSMQAIDWASAYPQWVPRMVSVIGSGQSDAWTTAALEHWARPIRLDKNWNDGDYTRQEPPTEGLVSALMLITQQALHPAFFNQQGNSIDYQPVEPAPLEDIRQSHSIVNWLEQRARSRADKMDANHLLYLVRACQLFVAGHKDSLQQGLSTIKAKTLFMPAANDLLLMPYLSTRTYEQLRKAGKNSHYAELQGNLGHLEGVLDIQEQGEKLKSFLNDDK
ncbi:E22 family MetX-like putative esterase [Salinimonas profundi]|nr:homoserine O-acetyltransferase [Salinimonas profundi]